MCAQPSENESPLKVNFPKWVNVDAAITWSNKRMYFFTGDWYWRYNIIAKQFDCGYPQLIAKGWNGLPPRIDSAYSSDKITFFTAGNLIYHYNNE